MSDQVFFVVIVLFLSVTGVNRTLRSFHGGLLEITHTVSLGTR